MVVRSLSTRWIVNEGSMKYLFLLLLTGCSAIQSNPVKLVPMKSALVDPGWRAKRNPPVYDLHFNLPAGATNLWWNLESAPDINGPWITEWLHVQDGHTIIATSNRIYRVRGYP